MRKLIFISIFVNNLVTATEKTDQFTDNHDTLIQKQKYKEGSCILTITLSCSTWQPHVAQLILIVAVSVI